METLSWIGTFVGGLGVGSALTAIIQYALGRHTVREERSFSLKKEAYAGLLSAIAEWDKAPEDTKVGADYELWVARCQLIAPPHVNALIQNWRSEESLKRNEGAPLNELLNAMRKDLGIAR
jgi:hypothetical protein